MPPQSIAVAPRQATPFSVAILGDRLEVSAVLESPASVDRLIKALEATKALLPEPKPERPAADNAPDDEAAH